MARFTKIPESDVAGTMGTILGKLAGGISTAANAALMSIEVQLITISNNLDQETESSLNAKLTPIEVQLTAIESSLAAIEASLSAIKVLITTLKVPITALKVAIQVIKLLPLPQMYLVVSITTVFSDLLEMLSELVAQVDEICESLSSVLDTIISTLEPIEAKIKQLRDLIELLKVRSSVVGSESMKEDDKEKLTNLGFFDKNGECLVDALISGTAASAGSSGAGALSTGDQNRHSSSSAVGKERGSSSSSSGGKEKAFVGAQGEINALYGLEVGDLDLSDVEVQNKISVVDVGNTVTLEQFAGDYIQEVYMESRIKPERPTSRKPVPDGWKKLEVKLTGSNYWITKATISGKTGKAGIWEDPKNMAGTGDSIFGVQGTGDLVGRAEKGSWNGNGGASSGTGDIIRSVEDMSSGKTIVILGIDDILSLKTSKENTLEGILKIRNSGEVTKLVEAMVAKIDRSSISVGLKESIRRMLSVLSEKEAKAASDSGKHYYTASDGTVYELVVVIDPNSPTIAPRRYVSVLDPSGTVVLEGTKSFSNSESILLEEMKVRLGQLFG